MKTMKVNIRGDSGLSDSQAMVSQKIFQKKNKEALDELEKYGTMETRRQRYEASAKTPKTSLWKKVKSWFKHD